MPHENRRDKLINAAFGIGLSADTQFPSVGADLLVASQADGECNTRRIGGISKGAGSPWGQGFLVMLDIGLDW